MLNLTAYGRLAELTKLVERMTTIVLRDITLGYQARWEEDFSRMNVQEASIGLNFSKFSGSLAYADISAAENYGRPDNEQQVWGDARYYLSDAWSVFGSARYDVYNGKPMGESLGVTVAVHGKAGEGLETVAEREVPPRPDVQGRHESAVRGDGTGRADAEILCLLRRELGQLRPDLGQVQQRDLLVEMLGQRIDLLLVLALVGPQLDLRQRLVDRKSTRLNSSH